MEFLQNKGKYIPGMELLQNKGKACIWYAE